MPEPDPDLLPVFPVQTEAQYKALAHPLRIGILHLLMEQPRTNEELARALGIDSGNSYFHLKRLLAVGFVKLVGTRQNRAITEKLYRAVARRYNAVSPFDLEGKPANWGVLQTGIELLQTTAQLYPDLFDHHYAARHARMFLTPEKVDWLIKALYNLFDEARQEAERSAFEESARIPISLVGFIHALPIGTRPDAMSHDIIGQDYHSADDLLTLKTRNVPLDYANQLRDLGYARLPVEELVQLHDHNISADYIKQLRDLGYGRLSVEGLVQLHAYNVSADYIRQLKAAGYRPLTVDRIIELKQHGINPSE